MNPETNRLEPLTEDTLGLEDKLAGLMRDHKRLLRPDGSVVPEGWSTFRVDEHVAIKGYTFKVAHIGESHVLFEPVGPIIIGGQ